MHNFIQLARKIVSQNKKVFFKSLLFILLLTVIQTVVPIAMRVMMEKLELSRSISLLASFLVLYILMQLITNLVSVGWYYMLDVLGGYILKSVRLDLCGAVFGADYRHILRYGKEKLKNTFYMDTINIYSCAILQSLTMVSNIVLILVYLIVTAYFSPVLSLVLLFASLCDFAISMLSRKKIASCSGSVNRQMKADSEVLGQCVDAIALMKQNNIEKYFYRKCGESTDNFINTAKKSDAIMIFLKNLNSNFSQIVSFAVAAFLTITMTDAGAGDLVFCLFISNAVLTTSQAIESAIYTIIKNSPSFNNVAEISQLPRNYGNMEIGDIENIAFNNVSFSYTSGGKKVLDNVNFTINKGDTVQLCGSNGSGKSTIFKLLTGLFSTDGGNILINGHPIEQIDKIALNNQICYIGQDEILLNERPINYLEIISGSNISDSAFRSLCDTVKLDNNIDKIYHNGSSLSGGQQKKLLILKMLLRCETASVILIDELDANLDFETSEILSSLENKLFSSGNKIIIKISHTDKSESYSKKINF